MPNRLNLTRDQLAAFLPDHQAVKQFEELFRQVTDVLPNANSDLEGIIGSGQNHTDDQLKRIVGELVLQPPGRTQNLDSILKRLEALEVQAHFKTDLTHLLTRLATLEAYLGL